MRGLAALRRGGWFIACTSMLAFSTAAVANEGMWTFDGFPAAKVKADLGFAPDKAWLDHVQGATVRLSIGCSGGIMSGKGLVLTNHHCVIDCVQSLSTKADDLAVKGFVATDPAAERKCAGQNADILTSISDVTATVRAAEQTGGAALERKTIEAIEQAACEKSKKLHCEVVRLYGGNQYKLYIFHRYSDVRLSFSPEYDVGQFGGVPDYFQFPRFTPDAAFVRLYEDGRPALTPTHLRWNPRAPVPGEAVFVVGNPGVTQRSQTVSQLALKRDLTLPITQLIRSEQRGWMLGAFAENPDKAREGRAEQLGVENMYKVYYGLYRSLLDPQFMGALAQSESLLKAKVAQDRTLAARTGDPWGEIDRAMGAYREIFLPHMLLEEKAGFGSSLFHDALAIVRAAQEQDKPAAERLPGYADDARPALRSALQAAEPITPWMEEAKLAFWLSKLREYLGVDDPAVQAILGKESPESLAHKLVTQTRLTDPAVRLALFDGGLPAVQASQDPLIRLVLASDSHARAIAQRYRSDVEAPVAAAEARLAQARFALFGDTGYPDANFTPRISYGTIVGWREGDKDIAPMTDVKGLFARSSDQFPFALPLRWRVAERAFDPATIVNFATSNDIVGGNSGSPAIARDGSVIGTLFDGNMHEIAGRYAYDGSRNRAIAASAALIDAELTHVYKASTLVKELRQP